MVKFIKLNAYLFLIIYRSICWYHYIFFWFIFRKKLLRKLNFNLIVFNFAITYSGFIYGIG